MYIQNHWVSGDLMGTLVISSLVVFIIMVAGLFYLSRKGKGKRLMPSQRPMHGE